MLRSLDLLEATPGPRFRGDAPDSRSGDGSSASPPGDPYVLIVEDDADLRDMMAQLLLLEGVTAHTAANGREALEYLHGSARPALILLDLMMPVMDGWEFRREQQRDPRLADVPVIILSALDQTRAGDIGEAAFMKKPLDFDRLIDLVRHFYRKH
jgi:CheY-like chemotaxis protein